MKRLVITGASRGIGLASARRFAADGWQVINLSRSPLALPGARQFTVDLGDPGWDAVHGGALLAALGASTRICLVHNAALLTKDATTNLDGATLARVLQVNVVSAQQLNRLLLPQMPPGSSILYIGSTLGEKAVAGACAYTVSKHAQIGLMRATCQDLAGRGVHTAAVCPGFTDTEMLRAHVGADPVVLTALAGGVTFGRLVEPEEIAAVIHFCATNAVVNGAVIHANLGQVER